MYDELRSLDPRQRRRVEQRLAVLAYASTCSMNAAALYFGISYRTVRRWRYHYRHGGILELAPRYPKERRRRITPEVRALIHQARTDLWALGAVLYEMVTGRRAFSGNSQVSLIGNIMNAEPASLTQLQPLTPPALDQLVRWRLSNSPDDLPDTAHDVAEELGWLRESGGQADTRSVVPRRGAWRLAGWPVGACGRRPRQRPVGRRVAVDSSAAHGGTARLARAAQCAASR